MQPPPGPGGRHYTPRHGAACRTPAHRARCGLAGSDGNSHGPPAEPERDRLVAEGALINGSPTIKNRPHYGAKRVPHHTGAVEGRARRFVVAAKNFDSFAAPIRRKLLQEVA